MSDMAEPSDPTVPAADSTAAAASASASAPAPDSAPDSAPAPAPVGAASTVPVPPVGGGPISATQITCLGCGFDLSGSALVAPCPECGRPVSESVVMGSAALARPIADPARNMSTAGFACALGSMFIFFPPGCLLGSILGFFALRRYRREGGTASSLVLAHCGIWIGLLGVAVTLGFIGLIFLG
ncbi:MAG: hypothetical protein AB8G96_08280 [Phycisphaerales bacterium]